MAMGADMMLLLPHLHLDVIGEAAQLKVTLLACEDVWAYAFSKCEI